MADKNDYDVLRGLFEGCTNNNPQINILTGDGIQISYQEAKAKEDEQKPEGVKKSLLDYVVRLMPVVSDSYKDVYMDIWQDILSQSVVSSVIYNRGSQKGTVFNRNLVARISHMFLLNGIIDEKTSDKRMTELLEPEKGKNHSVRGELAMTPEDKQVKKAVTEVLEKHKR